MQYYLQKYIELRMTMFLQILLQLMNVPGKREDIEYVVWKAPLFSQISFWIQDTDIKILNKIYRIKLN